MEIGRIIYSRRKIRKHHSTIRRSKKTNFRGSWNEEKAEKMTSEISKLHPENRELDTGFFYIDPSAIK